MIETHFFPPKLEITLRDGRNIIGEVFINPKETMSEDRKIEILERYVKLTTIVFTVENDSRESHYQHTFSSDLFIIFTASQFKDSLNIDENEIVALFSFHFYTINAQNIVYLAAAIVHPLLQGCGIFRGLLSSFFAQLGNNGDQTVSYFCTRTQNPLLGQSLLSIFDRVYPLAKILGCNSICEEEASEIRQIVKSLIDYWQIPSFDTETFVFKNLYGSSLMKEDQKSLIEWLQCYWEKNIVREQGDAFLLISPFEVKKRK